MLRFTIHIGGSDTLVLHFEYTYITAISAKLHTAGTNKIHERKSVNCSLLLEPMKVFIVGAHENKRHGGVMV